MGRKSGEIILGKKKLQNIPEHLPTLNFDKNKKINSKNNKKKNLSIKIWYLFIDIITYVR